MNYPVVDCPKHWDTLHQQTVTLGLKSMSIARLLSMAKDLEPFDLPIWHFSIPDQWLNDKSMVEIVGHIKMVLDADLTKPIILDHNGYILDGNHRLAKALLEGKQTISAVRFSYNVFEEI